eukprot:TRINITY_DN55029_c0_g1_i4.p1 TRINITY_DN55029_c0_g1~~TRINITY_DN55029_c0_g1_i4.p1  ORF type:complete len:463 (+),score=113.23 TRINITY_DN55029_c0_g1_i4:235-1623(+)
MAHRDKFQKFMAQADERDKQEERNHRAPVRAGGSKKAASQSRGMSLADEYEASKAAKASPSRSPVKSASLSEEFERSTNPKRASAAAAPPESRPVEPRFFEGNQPSGNREAGKKQQTPSLAAEYDNKHRLSSALTDQIKTEAARPAPPASTQLPEPAVVRGPLKAPLKATIPQRPTVAPPAVPAVPPVEAPKLTRERLMALREVFERFDVDKSGRVTPDELMKLGAARRQLGQKTGVWTKVQNDKLLRTLDTDNDGACSCLEFAVSFAERLPTEAVEFRATLRQFHEVASEVAKNRDEKAVCAPVSAVGENQKIRSLQAQLLDSAKTQSSLEIKIGKIEKEKFALTKEMEAIRVSNDSASGLRILNKELQEAKKNLAAALKENRQLEAEHVSPAGETGRGGGQTGRGQSNVDKLEAELEATRAELKQARASDSDRSLRNQVEALQRQLASSKAGSDLSLIHI